MAVSAYYSFEPIILILDEIRLRIWGTKGKRNRIFWVVWFRSMENRNKILLPKNFKKTLENQGMKSDYEEESRNFDSNL